MKGDFSRDTFDPGNHYTRVLMQQGRVHLDADFNEQAAIAEHHRRVLARDLIGPAGGPLDNAGFAVIADAAGAKALGKKLAPGDFVIGTGRYYVDGLLCENPAPLLYSEQPGYPFDAATTIDALAALEVQGGCTIYLDVWERHIGAAEAPGIAEVALGGPDTATRAQLTWQVRVLPDQFDGNGNPVTLDQALARVVPRLAARADPPAGSSDPCTVDPSARYRGLENQLYRVEVHAPGIAGADGGATYKWSRDNGSVIFPLADVPAVDAVASTTTVMLATLGRDADLGLVVGGWVELVDDHATLRHDAGPLLRVHSIDRDAVSAVLEGMADPRVGQDPRLHPYLRRWDHTGGPAFSGAVPVVESASEPGLWQDLEDGVQVIFAAAPSGAPVEYRTGDYWLIPARTATGDVQWPGPGWETSLNPQPLPPKGEERVHAALAGVGPDPAGGQGGLFTDVRKFFGPLAV